MLKAMDNERVKQVFATIGAERIGSSPSELKTYLADETAKWQKIIQKTGLSVN